MYSIFNATTAQELTSIFEGPFKDNGYKEKYGEVENPENWMKSLGFDNDARVKQFIIGAHDENNQTIAAVMAQVHPDGNAMVGFTPMSDSIKDDAALSTEVIAKMLKYLVTTLEDSEVPIGGVFMERPGMHLADQANVLKRAVVEPAGFSFLKTQDGERYVHHEPVWSQEEQNEIDDKGYDAVKPPFFMACHFVGQNGQSLPEALVSMVENYIKSDGFHAEDPEADRGLALARSQAENLAEPAAAGKAASSDAVIPTRTPNPF